MEIAWRNFKANRYVRPADVINGFRMMNPLSGMHHAVPPRDIAKMFLELFTRLEVTYQPGKFAENLPQHPLICAPRKSDNPRVGLFVDAPDHLSGVSMTLSEWLAQAKLANRDLTIHSSGNQVSGSGMVYFPPMGSIKLDAYAGLSLNIPRADAVLKYIQEMPFDVIHVSTPGPMGMLGVLAARQRGLPLCGTYHTDFPGYAGALTGDAAMEQIGWKFMRWFYGQLDRIAAPTESVRQDLIDHGFDSSRIHVVGRGVNTETFSPELRSQAWRERWGGQYPVKLIYVGRISREKNLETLTGAFRLLNTRRPDTCLVMVGDGPYREEMQNTMRDLPVFFTGTLKGRDLATAYASSDLFVFPSKTDTFGRVVLEAQSSGLPVVVSDSGGPKDVVIDKQTGFVIPDLNEINLAGAMDALTDDPATLMRYGSAARRYASRHTPEASFNAFWRLHDLTKPIETIPENRR
jgi:glycosyltransferase involved in cell wall biosynthesis